MVQRLISIVSVLEFTDVLDILIIAFIAYWLIGYLRKTRAAQLVWGVLIVFLIYAVADFVHLYTLSWLLEKVFAVGLVALVVVFQPELRRALEFIGRGRFSPFSFYMQAESYTANVDIIVRAVDYFAARKEGALIVIENQTALQDVADTGTPLDAKLTEQLLENVFYKGSPLHDGAVILRRDRILAAGCMLPLTENPNLSKDLGTRHRAGIGITEISDALVLIISEETGIISMAQDGKLSRFLDLKTLEKALLNLYIAKEPQNGGIARIGSGIFGKGGSDGTKADK